MAEVEEGEPGTEPGRSAGQSGPADEVVTWRELQKDEVGTPDEWETLEELLVPEEVGTGQMQMAEEEWVPEEDDWEETVEEELVEEESAVSPGVPAEGMPTTRGTAETPDTPTTQSHAAPQDRWAPKGKHMRKFLGSPKPRAVPKSSEPAKHGEAARRASRVGQGARKVSAPPAPQSATQARKASAPAAPRQEKQARRESRVPRAASAPVPADVSGRAVQLAPSETQEDMSRGVECESSASSARREADEGVGSEGDRDAYVREAPVPSETPNAKRVAASTGSTVAASTGARGVAAPVGAPGRDGAAAAEIPEGGAAVDTAQGLPQGHTEGLGGGRANGDGAAKVPEPKGATSPRSKRANKAKTPAQRAAEAINRLKAEVAFKKMAMTQMLLTLSLLGFKCPRADQLTEVHPERYSERFLGGTWCAGHLHDIFAQLSSGTSDA